MPLSCEGRPRVPGVHRVAETREATERWLDCLDRLPRANVLHAAVIDAIDEPRMELVAELLDGIPGAHERAQLGLRQARAGETIPLNEL